MSTTVDASPARRKRLRRVDRPGTARFLTFSCHRRLPLFRDDALKTAFAGRLALGSGVAVLAWVVMPEHVHLVVLPDDATPLDRWLNRLKAGFARAALNRWRASDAPVLKQLAAPGGPRFWQAGGGYDRNVWGRELLEKVRYCHANPVTRGLVTTPADHAWSSARRYEGRADAAGPEVAFDLLPLTRGPLT